MAFNNEIERVKAQIFVLEKKLALLEEMEKTKSPVEEAYKRVYGNYPKSEAVWYIFQKAYEAATQDYKVGEYQETAQERGERVHNEMEETIKIHDGYGVVDYKPTPKTPVEECYKDWWGEYPGDENWTSDATRWQGFQAGYNAAYEEKVAQEPEENEWKSVALRFGEKLSGYLSDGYYELSPAAWFRWAVFTYGKGQQIKETVRESVRWCEENPDKDPLDCLKPQTPEQTEQSLKEAFREAVKQGVVSSSTKPQTLTGLIYDWWDRVFGDTDDTETCIDHLVDEISLWLPTEHDTNSYKWNECIRMIREKLR